MSKVVLVANLVDTLNYDKNNTYIGVDKGSLYCMEHQIPLLCAIGDFDSIEEAQLSQLKEITRIIKLPAEKNEVDSEYALRYAKELGYEEIEIFGVTGGRQDHFLALYHLLCTGDIDFTIRDTCNLIYRLDAGCHSITKRSKYLSFFACESLMISIRGVKYPLNEKKINQGSTFLVSNEIINTNASLKITGRVIVVESELENIIEKKV